MVSQENVTQFQGNRYQPCDDSDAEVLVDKDFKSATVTMPNLFGDRQEGS